MKVSMCEYNLCIYWDNYKCTCEDISINTIGNCDAIIQVNLDEPTLKKLRKEMLEKIEERYN